MKHPLATAILAGFTGAMAIEIKEGDMTAEQGARISRMALAATREYLKNRRIFSKNLSDFHPEDQSLDGLLTADKINLQQWGD